MEEENQYIPKTEEECKLNEIIGQIHGGLSSDLKRKMIHCIIIDNAELSFDLRDRVGTIALFQVYFKKINQKDSFNADDADDDDDLPA